MIDSFSLVTLIVECCITTEINFITAMHSEVKIEYFNLRYNLTIPSSQLLCMRIMLNSLTL